MTMMRLYELRADYVKEEMRYGAGLWATLCNLFARLWLRKLNKIRAKGSYEELIKELAEKPRRRGKNG